jgi:hypothetical protein
VSHFKKNQNQFARLCFGWVGPSAWFGLTAWVGLTSCGDRPKELSLLEEVRVPVAQFLQEVDAAQVGTRKGCEVLSDGKTYCQQYPLRFGQRFLLRYVVISPLDQKPKFELTKMELLGVRRQGESVVSSVGQQKVPLDSLKLKKLDPLSSALQEKGMRVEQVVYELEIPNLDSYVSQRAIAPSYLLSYKATVPGKPEDTGQVSFFVYPDANDNDTWNSLKNLAKQNGLDATLLDVLRRSAKTNTPPQVKELLPKSGEKVGGTIDLEITLGTDADKDARTRIQWFTTNGEISKKRAKETEWKSEGDGPLGAFVVVRDLQGGMDFKFAHYAR